MATPIRVSDVPGPEVQLCWHQGPKMDRCDRRLGHKGLHTWESARAVCVWTPVDTPDSSDEIWASGCGRDYKFERCGDQAVAAGPVEFNFLWCPFCGGGIAIA